MIEIDISIRRSNHFYSAFGRDSVKDYLKEIIQIKEKIKKHTHFDLDRVFAISRDQIDKIIAGLDEEEKYCNFYLDLIKQKKSKNFNTWVFLKNKDRQEEDWRRETLGDCWVITNGKVKATINIKDNITSTKVSLEVQNDNKHLVFYSKSTYAPKEINYTNLRNKESIKNKIIEFKFFDFFCFIKSR